MEPVGAALAPDIELSLVVRLAAQAVDLVIVLGAATLVTHILGHFLGHLGGYADTQAVEPIGTDIATNVEPAK